MCMCLSSRFCKSKTFDVASSVPVAMLLHGGAAWSALVFVSAAVGRCRKAVPARHTNRELQQRSQMRYLRCKFSNVRGLGDVSMLEPTIQEHADVRVHRLPPRHRLVVRQRQRVLRSRGMHRRPCARFHAKAQAVCTRPGVEALSARGRRLQPAADLPVVVRMLRVSLDIHIKHASGFHTSVLTACLYCAAV